LQPKLLRVLEAREFRRVGGSKTLAADVRVVAATTRDLTAEVRKGSFREDLYFRLAVVPVHVPPLRKRGEDVGLIAEAILTAITADGAPALTLPKETLHSLRVYEWPGNVRELRNVLERCAYLARASGKRELRLVDFPPTGAVPDEENVFEFDEA